MKQSTYKNIRGYDIKPNEFRTMVYGYPMIEVVIHGEPEVDVFGDSIGFGDVVLCNRREPEAM